MGMLRRIKRGAARLTGLEAVLQRRLDTQAARYQTQIDKLEAQYEYAARQARVQRRRAQGAEKLYRTNRRRAAELAALVRTLDRLPRHQYGSLLPGNREWEQKWRDTSGQRILLFSKRDYSGSFYKWTAAINRYTPHAARLAVSAPHQYGYPVDLLIPNPNLIESDWHSLWDEADILHLKDETGFLNASNRLPPEMLQSFKGPRVFTQYGGYARKHCGDPDYQRFVHTFDKVVSMTPDLCFDWLGPDPTYVPHSIDTEAIPYQWSDAPVIGHSPSTRARKGTEEFLEAVRSLQTRYSLDLDLIEGVTHSEAVERKSHVGLFFDQAGRENAKSLGTDSVIGWYGNSALEAAVYGVPTIAHMSEVAFLGAERAGMADVRSSPIVNTGLGKEGIESSIRGLLEMSSDERSELSKETRRFVEEFHSQRAIGKQLAAVYAEIS